MIFDLEEEKLHDSGKEESKTFPLSNVLGMNDDLWDGVRVSGSLANIGP